jgi:HEPN domain-containing protein
MGRKLSSEDAETVQKHLQGADDQLAHADWLHSSSGRSDSTTVGWAITSLFYAAVHAVRAYLVSEKGEKVTAHAEMRGFYEKYPELKKTKSAYDLLKQESEGARYYLTKFTWEDFAKLRPDARKVIAVWGPKAAANLPGAA